MEKNIKVSIVVPIYNVEKYLNQCLKSIKKQTLKEIEIICVDDGSTDKSLDIVKKYALKDKIVDLIDIINNFELAVNNSPNNPEIQNYLKGFSMFSNMFKNYLADSGVKEIQINVNDEFDPNTMDPFETVEVKGVKPNLVTKIIKKGYKLHDRVVKHAIVQVSK